MKKPSAGQRDLSLAVAQVHVKDRSAASKTFIDDNRPIDAALLLSAGDEPQRASYFDLNDQGKAVKSGAKSIHIVLGKKASLPDYRNEYNVRTHRTFIAVPPKVRDNIRAGFGVDSMDEFPLTTAVVALAEYGLMVLKRDGKLLQVTGATDDLDTKRKAEKKKVRVRNR